MNLVYINTHDTGRMISPYGVAVPTPHLQNLAEDGTLFTQAFCCGPTCSPSRAAMLTGTYPHQNGMYGLAQRGFSLHRPDQHLASWLKQQGYQTAISGIQHEVGWYLDLDEQGLHDLGYENILTTSSKEYAKEDLHMWDRANVLEAVKWLDRRDPNKPFMLSYGMHSTHRPYPIQVADNIDERYVKPVFGGVGDPAVRHDQAQYMTTAQYADENAHILIEALKERNLLDSTVIMYTTDHGLANPFHKCTLSDRGIGVSLIVRHPEMGHGEVCDHLVSHLDVFPTLCDLLNVKKPDYLEGVSFAETFKNAEHVHREEVYAEVNFHTSYEPMRCVRTSRYKYVHYFDESWTFMNLSNIDESAPKDQLMKHGLRDRHKPMEALYDLMYDPDETCNLIENEALSSIREELKKKLFNHMEKTNDPLLKGHFEILPHYKVNNKDCLMASSKNPNDYDPRGRK